MYTFSIKNSYMGGGGRKMEYGTVLTYSEFM